MAISISSIGAGAPAILFPSKGESGQGAGFRDLLEGAINRVGNLQQVASQGIEKALSGEGEELHNTVLATQRAELAFEMFMQVRNKVTQAYQEIMRMQI